MMDEETLKYAMEIASYYAVLAAKRSGHTGDRDDFRQQILLQIIRKLPKYDSKKSKIKTFLHLVAKHECWSILRKIQTYKRKTIQNARRFT